MLTRSKRKLEIEVSTRPLDFFDFTELLKADLPTMEFLAEPFKEKDNESFEEYDYGGLDFEDCGRLLQHHFPGVFVNYKHPNMVLSLQVQSGIK